MNAKEMRMKERLDILIQLGLEEDDALELLKSVYVEGALIGFAMARLVVTKVFSIKRWIAYSIIA